MAETAQKARRIKYTDPSAPSVNWLTAKEVPVEVLHRENSGKPVDGMIVFGPMGQTTFIGKIKGRSVDAGTRDAYQLSD